MLAKDRRQAHLGCLDVVCAGIEGYCLAIDFVITLPAVAGVLCTCIWKVLDTPAEGCHAHQTIAKNRVSRVAQQRFDAQKDR